MADKDIDYDYVDPEEEDPFISVETCKETDKPEPQMLQSLISQKNGNIKNLNVEDFISVFENNQGTVEKDSLRCAETLLIPKLQKSKDITSLSKLLSIDERKFQNCVLRSIQKLLMEMDLNEYTVEVVQMCLKNVVQLLQKSQEEDSLQTIVMSLPTVLRCSAIAVMLHCCFRKEKKSLLNNISKSCETIEKMWNTGMSRKKIEIEEPSNYQMVKGGLALVAVMGKFKYGKHLKDLFQSLDDSFTSSEHEMSLRKIGTSGAVAEQYVIILGILTKMTNNPQHMCEKFISFLHPILHQKQIERRWTEPEFQQLGYLIICGTAFITRKFSQIETTRFHDIIDVCTHNNQLVVPEEMSDLLFSLNATIAQPIISCLNLSEGAMIQLAESYIGRAIPGLVVHNQDRRILPKMSDHSHWMVSRGRLFLNLVRIAIKVPGISHIQIQNFKNPVDSQQLVNEFDILKTLQGEKTHVNIVKMLAFNPLSCRLPFYVIESFQTFLIDKLLHARKHQEFFSHDWMNDRLLDIASAIDYLHQKKIIHRDITINSFAIREYPSNGHEKAVLCSLQMACSNDDETSAKTGHVGDIYGENIPTRWSAPESLWEDKYDVYTDIWMIGHVIHTLFTYGCEPYTELYSETTDDIMAKVISCDLKPYKWLCVPLPYHQLAKECLNFDRGKRPHIQFMCQQLKKLRNEKAQLRKSYCELEAPKISDQQTERGHKPERGIPLMVKKMKEMPGIEDRRESYFAIKTRVPMGSNPDYSPLVLTLGPEDLLSHDEPKIRKKRFEVEVEEEVTVHFHDKILPKMSKDFGEKMCITKWPPDRRSSTLQEVKITLKYSFPVAKNIMDLASSYTYNSHQKSDDPLHIVHQVACLVKRMHEKRWLLVDLTGKNIYIQEENDFKACQVRIGRMTRLSTGEDSVMCGRKLEDIMYWLPKEVIGHGEISTGSDVYTMAMLFYEFYMAVSGNDRLQCVPFSYKHKSQILGHLYDGHFPDRPPACPIWLYEEVMKPCWDQDRTSRPTAAAIEGITKRRIRAVNKRAVNAVVNISDRFENKDKKLTELSENTLGKNEASNEDYVYVEEHESTIPSSGSICPEENANTFYINERTSKVKHDLGANTSNEAELSTKGCHERQQRKGSQEFQNLPSKEHLNRGQSAAELIDVPNYELFSQSSQLDVGTEEEYPYTEILNYENDTILSSGMNISDPQPFRSNRTPHLDLPVSHVHKENPIFQSDASSYRCAHPNPSGQLDCELQLPTRSSACKQEDSSDDSDCENDIFLY